MNRVILTALTTGILLLPLSEAAAQSTSPSIAVQYQKVDINQADIKQLMKLPGIGKKKAQAIIDYMLENGQFQSVDDISKVKGIGKKLASKLKDKIES